MPIKEIRGNLFMNRAKPWVCKNYIEQDFTGVLSVRVVVQSHILFAVSPLLFLYVETS